METALVTDHGKIQLFAVAYLELQRKSPHLTEKFLDNLRSHLGWSRIEVTQLLMRVVDVLLEQGAAHHAIHLHSPETVGP